MRFKQSVELSQWVFKMMDGGKKVFPQEGITEIRDILIQIQNTKRFSYDDLMLAYDMDRVNKELFPTVDDVKKELEEQGYYIEDRNTNEKSKKCFCDECEWRYVPNVRGIGLKQAIPEHEIPNTGLLTTYSNSMDGIAEVSLCFEYNEIKHIIIPTLDEYRQLVENIDLWKLGDEKYDILSKIIVWEQSRGDF